MQAANLTARAMLLAGLLALATAPLWADNNLTRILGEGLVLCALAILWNLLAGYGGRVSVGQQAYVGIGAYAMLALCLYSPLPPLLSIPAAGLIGAVLSLPIALLLFRLQGHYFAIATWAVAEILRLVVMQIPELGGGSGTSLPGAVLRAISPDRAVRAGFVYWTVFAIFGAVFIGALMLMRSRWGLALRAMRDSELAAESVGIRLQPLRLTLYCVVGGLTAAVGAVVLLQKLRISPDAAFNVQDWTAFVLFIAVIGGVGTLEGPIIGTLIFIVLRETLADYGPAYLIILGLVGVATMLFAPKGIWGGLGGRGLSLLPDRHTP